MENGATAHNKRYTLRRRRAARATKKPSRAYALCGFFLRHIFAVAGTLRVPLSQPQKRRIPGTLCVIGAGWLTIL
jgi:hypothetical protein